MRRVVEQKIQEKLINICHLNHPDQTIQIPSFQHKFKSRVYLMHPRQSLHYIKLNLFAIL